MFTRALKQCSNEKRRFFGENQRIFVHRLPIDFFYFADFRGSVENQWGNNLLFILIILTFALWKKKCYAPWQLLFCLLKY